MDVARFKQLPLMGILRGIKADVLEPLLETVIKCGLETIEITMNTPQAPSLIHQAVQFSGGRLVVGAGTVLNRDSLKSALEAGASFIVTPVFNEEVFVCCRKNNIPFFPGALTPTEIYRAWEYGPAMVKVFPSKFFGSAYFKEIKGPFENIELLACGGVSPQEMGVYFSNGASAVAFGASVFNKEWLQNRQFDLIGEKIRSYVEAFTLLA
ncbi:MAG: bifunctional 4-hydroxy-2-oxoglutarate aldolase/2-dehydro-3-deoxy-phosphogluconate aldolase [Candidatus Omnitrophota bacterium]